MTTFIKNGIEVCMPEDDERSRQNMIIAAEFMARMIQKYTGSHPAHHRHGERDVHREQE